jgi:hypothetical protein
MNPNLACKLLSPMLAEMQIFPFRTPFPAGIKGAGPARRWYFEPV